MLDIFHSPPTFLFMNFLVSFYPGITIILFQLGSHKFWLFFNISIVIYPFIFKVKRGLIMDTAECSTIPIAFFLNFSRAKYLYTVTLSSIKIFFRLSVLSHCHFGLGFPILWPLTVYHLLIKKKKTHFNVTQRII